MAKLIKIGIAAAAVGWLHSIGALDPKLWKDTIQRERERVPGQIREALGAGRRAAAQAEEELDREVRSAFESNG